MNKRFLVPIIFLLIFSVACNNTPLTEQQKLEYEISKLEEKLHNEIEPDKEKAIAMIDKYLDYTEKYPDDSLSPEYLFKAAEIAMNFSQPHNAIRYLTQIEDNYLKYPKYPTAIFLKAFIYDTHIGDIEKSKAYYLKYLEKYPNHTFATDAKAAVMFMGLTDEQLIELFDDMNKYN
ncbi:MAG: hypothetical protein PHP52_06515 [Bacteroidales bacterium]|nr:hypothetical protein [Bacteroidales bacterium]MDD4217100.1 hypothetical protein [Bacteroidales bacterium]MDY0142331.1 hypothetical protein [Bacteroidales bacterium]